MRSSRTRSAQALSPRSIRRTNQHVRPTHQLSGSVGAERPENQLFAKPWVLQSVIAPPRAKALKGGAQTASQNPGFTNSWLVPPRASERETGPYRPAAPSSGGRAPQLSCPPASWVASGPLRRPKVRRAGACTARTRARTGAAASTRGRLPGREMQSASRPGSGSGLSSPSRRLWPPQAAASLSAPASCGVGPVSRADSPNRTHPNPPGCPCSRDLEEFRRPPGGGQ